MTLARERFASDVQRWTRQQREHRRDMGPRLRERSRGFSPWSAAAIAGGVVALAALAGRRYSPDRSHPRIDRWYHQDLDKPSFTPPDPVFGAVWPVLELLVAAGAYRLLKEPQGRERNVALALWAFNIALIPGWTKIFFGDRNLGGAAIVAAVQLGSGLAYVEAARRVDPAAAWLGLPYVGWIGFANVIATEVWRENA